MKDMRQQRRQMDRCVRAVALLVLAVCAGVACSGDKATPDSEDAAGHSDAATAPSSPASSASTAARQGSESKPVTMMASGSAGSNGAAAKSSAPPGGSGGATADAARAGSKSSAGASAAGVDAAGRAASAGAASTAGSGLPDVYVCQAMFAAQPPDPSGEGAEGSACCAGRGSCQLRSSSTLDLKAAFGHDSCKASDADDDLACAPIPGSPPKPCHGETGAASLEGRCLPRCFLLGTPTALLLTSSDCAADEACGACFDPVTGKASGACTLQPGDQPKEPAPAPFKPCGTYEMTGPSAGVCMPKVLAHASKSSAVDLLPQDSCSDSEVCMPNLKAANYTDCFAPCEASALVQAAGSKEGGCIPPYVAAFSNPEAVTFLEQGKCAEGELCAPCLDPTKDFAVSGACH